MSEEERPGKSGKVDPDAYRKSIDRLTEIFRSISETVNVVSTYRCPYTNVQNRCTAQFGCRNQDRSTQPGELYPCTGDDNLDYRAAWET